MKVVPFARSAIRTCDEAMVDPTSTRAATYSRYSDESRLSRDYIEAELTIRSLEFRGIRIVSTSDGYDSTSKARKITRGFKNLMNEQFLDDLRERVHRGLSGQALRGHWCGGRPYGYKLKPILDPSRLDAYGQPAQIGTQLEIDEAQATVVREIFERYIAGQSHRAIAADLNERQVPSTGTTWARKKHRASGWMGSAIRVNQLYIGEVCWNKNKFVRNPETERIVRRARPKSEWIITHDEGLRIIGEETFTKAMARSKVRSNADGRLKRGGKVRYLLSGLLRCDTCGANFVSADAKKYACSSYVNGGASACSNKTRVRRDVLERGVIGPIKDELLDPDRIRRMASKLQKQFNDLRAESGRRGVDAPRELAELDARLDRLRERLRKGDLDMEPDELQTAIDRVHAKRQQLATSLQPAEGTAKVLAMLPKAAEMYCKQIVAGLDGHPEATGRRERFSAN